ncbi:preprotein translocase subunit YajC [Campylobacter sp. FMV-PI01]|uniref:Sec translocon accessory complex subunit YajC n=1 Tax=Campylobacter portucalensis TaxID=2608384 RepID=A0A6L5WHX7_9BACT|nr:preprotein translocase subunit YajC [Campylobacter portucalensis]MSN96052.1 preprotein translocase subunit YajC [Campylobacter portucalensis]
MGSNSIFGTLFPLVIFFLIFYFLVIRPQQKQAKAHAKMLNELAKGDKILTAGGFKCTVIKPGDDFITVKLNDDIIVELSRNHVARKLEKIENA